MGNTLSNNSVDQTLKVYNNILNQSYQQCTNTNIQSQGINISGNVGSTINVNGVTFSQNAQTFATCESTDNFLNDVTQNLEQNAEQIADAVKAGFSLTGTDAENIANLYTKLSNEISTTYSQDCTYLNNQTQLLNIANNVDSNINVSNVNFDQSIDVINQCIAQNSSVNAIAQEIEQSLEQSAKSKSIGLLAIILGIAGVIAIILIVGVLLLVFLGGTTAVGIGGAAISSSKTQASNQNSTTLGDDQISQVLESAIASQI